MHFCENKYNFSVIKIFMKVNDIILYIEMCKLENKNSLQRWMNFRLNPKYSVILMSTKNNSIYNDKIIWDWIIEYEWHDIPKNWDISPKDFNQEKNDKNWNLTQNWRFIKAIENFKSWKSKVELVKVYEKIYSWIWSFKWFFELFDYKIVFDWRRKVFKFLLKFSSENILQEINFNLEHNRIIPTEVKKKVWIRDKWKCIICWEKENLHFDHDLPFSKWWTSLSEKNIRLLCMSCNLKKSDKIE